MYEVYMKQANLIMLYPKCIIWSQTLWDLATYNGQDRANAIPGMEQSITSKTTTYVCNFILNSEHVMILLVNSHLKQKINIVQVVAEKDTIKTSYEQIDNVFKRTKRHDFKIIIGDIC